MFEQYWSEDSENGELRFDEEELKILTVEDKYLIDSDSHWLICYAFKLDSNQTLA